MNGKDATGRRISLLNDVPVPPKLPSLYSAMPYDGRRYSHEPQHMNSYSQPMSRGASSQDSHNSSFPATPELLRSDSYNTQESISPITPAFTAFDDRSHIPAFELEKTSAPSLPSSPSTSPISPISATAQKGASVSSVRTEKRYPCQFNCGQKFTTSGHASRHSKIHLGVKPFTCSWEGCGKTFQRKDNMSQHYKTHADKEGKPSKSSRRPTTVERSRPSQKRSKSSKTIMSQNPLASDMPHAEADFSHSPLTHTLSPSTAHYYDNHAPNRARMPRMDSIGGIGGGLETLAIVANQLQHP